MHLFVIGAGPVGLTTAAGFAKLGHRVTVHDTDASRVATIAGGRAPFFEPGLDELVAETVRAGRLTATDLNEPPADAAISIVCVPTPARSDGRLSMHVVLDVVDRLLARTGPEHVIAVRSTLPLDGPDLLLDLAARAPARAAVVTNPEFMREGNAIVDFERPNRVIVGWLTPADRAAAERVASLYAPLEATTVVADARSVALGKLGTNVFLALKIGFANELARLSDAIGADVDVVTRCLGLDPRIGAAFLRPGPGFGGSCLPEQAIAIASEADARNVATELLAAVGRVNDTHQRELVARIADLLGGSAVGCRVAILGLAFKANTDDVRRSPGLALAAALRAAGSSVVGHDPMAGANARAADPDLAIADDPATAASEADGVVIATEWPAYASLDWAQIAQRMRGSTVFDTRAVADRRTVEAAGLTYVALGRPSVA